MAYSKVTAKAPAAPRPTSDIPCPATPATPEITGAGSTDESDILAELKSNWGTDDMRDMIMDDTWSRGIEVETVTFDRATLVALRDLSEVSKGEADLMKKELRKKWSDRDHSHYNRDKPKKKVRIGTNWTLKQRNMREDILWFMQDLARRAGAPKITKRKDKDENVDEEDDAEEKGKGPAKEPRRPEGNEEPTHRNNRNANPARPTKKSRHISPSRSRSRPPSLSKLPPPEWSDSEPLHSEYERLRAKLMRYWNLGNVNDAIPPGLRSAWTGPIEKWGIKGTSEGIVLKGLCGLACDTRGRHEKVLQVLKEVIAGRNDGRKWMIYADIEVVRAHFISPVAGVQENNEDVNGDEEEEMREDQAPRLPSESHFSPSPQLNNAVQLTDFEHHHNASGATQRLRDRSNSLANATYELSAAINAMDEAEALLEYARNERAQVLSDGRSS